MKLQSKRNGGLALVLSTAMLGNVGTDYNSRNVYGDVPITEKLESGEPPTKLSPPIYKNAAKEYLNNRDESKRPTPPPIPPKYAEARDIYKKNRAEKKERPKPILTTYEIEMYDRFNAEIYGLMTTIIETFFDKYNIHKRSKVSTNKHKDLELIMPDNKRMPPQPPYSKENLKHRK